MDRIGCGCSADGRTIDPEFSGRFGGLFRYGLLSITNLNDGSQVFDFLGEFSDFGTQVLDVAADVTSVAENRDDNRNQDQGPATKADGRIGFVGHCAGSLLTECLYPNPTMRSMKIRCGRTTPTPAISKTAR
jgi:hypothetical protein